MRLRFAVLASVLTSFVVIAAPGIVNAAPRHNDGLTINALPHRIVSGEGVLIYGQLKGTGDAGKTIVLFHHVIGSHQGYVKIGQTLTNSIGQYEFTREVGVVRTNRSWFVREAGVTGVHSRTVYEHVDALVSLAATKTVTDTNHPVVFYGKVSPNHPFERVLLQEQRGTVGDDWKTIDSTYTGPGSSYYIAHSWRHVRDEGIHTLRTVFVGDARNDRGASDPVTVTVVQAQVPGFTITSSAPIIAEGQPVTISGVLTSTAAAPTSVTLYGHQDGQRYQAIASTTTGTDGSYSFALTGALAPTHNEVYQVRTTLAPKRHTAQLFEGVQDVIKLSPGSSTATVGQPVTFTGTVAPNLVNHRVYLERKGDDGDWHNIAVTTVNSASGFTFTREFGDPGAKLLRARIYGGPENIGAVSTPVTVTVSGVASLGSLPPAS
jgi:hypothetical protein